MAAQQGILRVHQEGPTLHFQAEGVLRMPHSLPLRRSIEHGLGDGACAVHIDLRRCTYMDSTFIGTLLCLLKEFKRASREFKVVSPSRECGELFHQMGLDRVLPIATKEEESGPWSEVMADTGEVETCKRNVIQAHQSLADLDGDAGEPFRAVMRTLSRETEVKSSR